MNKISNKKILLLGFGRMGVSHALQISGILRNRSIQYEITIIETSILARLVATTIFQGKVKFQILKKLEFFEDNYFDFAIDATPPINRVQNKTILERISKSYLIEKPLLTKISENGMSGYVLQHNPLIDKLKTRLKKEKLKEINISLKTNLSFKNENGWRSGIYGGVVNEFLGHLLSVPLSCLEGLQNLKVENVISNPGKIEVFLHSSSYPLKLVLEYGSSSVRKSTYNWKFMTESENIIDYDGYQINIKSIDFEESIGLADLGISVEYYLRGFDFCYQGVALIDGKGDKMQPSQLELIDSVIYNVIKMVKA
tara:strand:+ start:1440 stop:2375 length:936 start_codon:yes stop_codon:yes gene_type:complete